MWRRLWSGRFPHIRLKAEETLAIQCQDWLRLTLPSNCIAIHIPMEAQRSKASWAVQFAMGAMPGWPDAMIVRAGGFLYLIEYKAGKAKLRPEQKEIFAWAVAHDVPIVLVRNLDDLVEFCRAQLLIPVDSPVNIL